MFPGEKPGMGLSGGAGLLFGLNGADLVFGLNGAGLVIFRGRGGPGGREED